MREENPAPSREACTAPNLNAAFTASITGPLLYLTANPLTLTALKETEVFQRFIYDAI